MGLEPIRQRHTPLKRACLPIPALPRANRIIANQRAFVNIKCLVFYGFFSVGCFLRLSSSIRPPATATMPRIPKTPSASLNTVQPTKAANTSWAAPPNHQELLEPSDYLNHCTPVCRFMLSQKGASETAQIPPSSEAAAPYHLAGDPGDPENPVHPMREDL